MKWIARRERRRNLWHLGPEDLYYTARTRGVRFEIAAKFDNPLERVGPTWWYVYRNDSYYGRFCSLADAQAACHA